MPAAVANCSKPKFIVSQHDHATHCCSIITCGHSNCVVHCYVLCRCIFEAHVTLAVIMWNLPKTESVSTLISCASTIGLLSNYEYVCVESKDSYNVPAICRGTANQKHNLNLLFIVLWCKNLMSTSMTFIAVIYTRLTLDWTRETLYCISIKSAWPCLYLGPIGPILLRAYMEYCLPRIQMLLMKT